LDRVKWAVKLGVKKKKKKKKNAIVELGFGLQTALKLRTSQYACCLITVARARFRFDLRALSLACARGRKMRRTATDLQSDRLIDGLIVDGFFAFTGDVAFGRMSFDS
jgi:hypothetical protein